MRAIIAALVLLLVPGTARAEWFEASSAHFVVYAQDSDRRVYAFAQQLERYHAALEAVTNMVIAPPSPSNRVTVYVMDSVRDVRKLAGGNSRQVGGFYIGRAGGSLAIVPQISLGTESDGSLDFSMIVLLHEYAHHFMIANSGFPMPPWLSEGGAEFFASASFERDGTVGLGRPAMHRAGELHFARDVTVAQLLDPAEYHRRRASGRFESYYGKAWLLYHYLILGGKRPGQLEAYLKNLIDGQPPVEAGVAAFGPLNKLEGELDSYLRSGRMNYLRLPPSMIRAPQVTLRRLGEGEAAILPVVVRSRRGVDAELAREVVAEARAIAARYPGDATVQAALAEAEFDAGDDAAAIAAADRALAIDRATTNAYVQKGYAMFRQAEKSDDPAAFGRARAPFVALNRIENDNALALVYFHRSFAHTGAAPPKLAVDGLKRAADLAPFDLGLRMTLAMQLLRDGDRAGARAHLMPIAYSPHAAGLADAAREAMERMEGEPSWRGEGTVAPRQEDAGKGSADSAN
jgi:tetratricopeptide (TPR) repeat protein